VAPADLVAGASAGAAGPLLDEATHSVEEPRATPRGSWVVAHHVQAGEGSIAWNLPPLRRDEATDSALPREPGALDPDRSARESTRRARTSLRRYCASLGIDKLGTLTFRCRRCRRPEGCVCAEGPDRPRHDERDYVLGCIEAFRRAVMARFGRIPLVVVIEEHDDGHLHVHFGFSKYLDKYALRKCWPHGFVDLRRLRVKGTRAKRSHREHARACASYLAKYVTKDPSRSKGDKGYSTTRGLVAPPRRSRFMTKEECERWLLLQTGSLPEYVWSSDEMPEWEAPPVLLLFYGDGPDG